MALFNPAKYLSRVNVIVSDNDEKMLKMMTDVLKKLGFGGVFAAQDGFEAVEMLQKKKVDLIITDWELAPQNLPPETPLNRWDMTPPENGASFVQFVRGSKASPSPYIPIIMLTGNAQQQEVETARDAGVDDILVKPVSAVSLCKRLVKIVNSPRLFISTQGYKGPCRRRRSQPVDERSDRRKITPKEIKRSL